MYKNKYLKYKQKYIELQKYQTGGLIRGEITRLYKNNINLFIENREQNLALLLHSYNIPYSKRLDKVYGMWYGIDYSRLINNDDNSMHKYFKENYLLPNISIYTDEKPDMTKIPFLCYPYEMNYNGVDPLKLSSIEFYIKMAKMCGVNPNQSKIKIIEDIREKIPYLIDNRHLLKIDEFKK